MESINVLKDPILGPITMTCAIFIPAIVINGVTGARFGFYSVFVVSVIIGISIAWITRKIR